ncbi:MAG: hypothetical protein AAGJ81_14250 [Verrucomicrobiota bacterium]
MNVRTRAASIATLAGASSAHGIIVTNTDLGLSGFTVGDDGSTFVSWDIDDTGSSELFVVDEIPYINFTNASNDFRVRVTGNSLLNLGEDNYVNTGNFKNNGISSILKDGDIDKAVGFASGESGYIGFSFNSGGSTVFG